MTTIYKTTITVFLLLFLNTECLCASALQNTFTKTFISFNGQYDIYTDSSGKASLNDILALPKTAFFQIPNEKKITKPGEVYWLRFKINNISEKGLILETPRDYRISELYTPITANDYKKTVFDSYKFWGQNDFLFNNPSFTIPIKDSSAVFYLRLSSGVIVGLGYVLYDTQFAHNKAMKKFIQIFTLIGVLFLALLYSLVFYIRLKDKAFLYYLFYLLNLLIFSLSQFGATYPIFKYITFEYSYFTIPYGGMTIFLLLYIDQVLNLKQRNSPFHNIIYATVFFRIAALLIGTILDVPLLLYPQLDYFCLLFGLIPAILNLRDKNHYSKILVLSLFIIFIAFTIRAVFKTLIPISDYEIGQDNDLLFFIFTTLEVVLLSFTLTERYIQLRKEKEKSQLETIKYQEIALSESLEKEKLKEMLNRELETMVAQRTAELRMVNSQLKEQAEEIEQINESLKTDNKKLASHVETLHHARLLDRNMSFDEFKEIFPDDIRCQGFVAGLKWQNGFECRKCGYKKFYEGYAPHSRKCKLCRNTESATANTLFDNVKFSLQKALYIGYYTYSSPTLNIRKLSETIELREATCNSFSKKVSEVIQKLKPISKSNIDWTHIITHI